jgi:hypothetical protein
MYEIAVYANFEDCLCIDQGSENENVMWPVDSPPHKDWVTLKNIFHTRFEINYFEF